MSIRKAREGFDAPPEIPMHLYYRSARGAYQGADVVIKLFRRNPEDPGEIRNRKIGLHLHQWHVSAHLTGQQSPYGHSFDVRDFEKQEDAEEAFNALVREYELKEEIKTEDGAI